MFDVGIFCCVVSYDCSLCAPPSCPTLAFAVVDLAAVACDGDAPRVIPITSRVETVASAMAEAMASVIATCEGEDAVAIVAGTVDISAQAEAVSNATARVIADSNVCQICRSGFEAVASTVHIATANAVARAEIAVRFLRRWRGALCLVRGQRVCAQRACSCFTNGFIDRSTAG